MNGIGYDIIRYDARNARARLATLLIRHNITLVLDVGASRGDFGWHLRELGYCGRIVSFEPMQDAFRSVQQAARADKSWQAVNIALGDNNESRIIHVAKNSDSSSFLPMLDAHTQAAPGSCYQRDELVTVRRLEDILGEYRLSNEEIFLKVDTQGFEKNVICGARAILGAVPLIQLECSYVPLYENADLIEGLIGYMRDLGYDPIDSAPSLFSPNKWACYATRYAILSAQKSG